MIHLKVTDRWPQTRGEPWLHAVAEKLQDMSGYSEAEIIAARGAASYIGIIQTPEETNVLADEQSDGSFQMQVDPGTWMRTAPGETAEFISPNRPNAALDPFMRFMLREIAAGVGVSYESLSRDYSQSNYSSSRLALLDDRDNWRSLQIWFIRAFRERLHKEWLKAAVLAGEIPEIDVASYALDPESFECAKFRARGWSWVDPTKEVAAFKEAVKAGFTTVEKVISITSDGDDLEDVMNARESELTLMDEKNLAFDTSPSVYVPAETRGQMLVGPAGTVVSAASLAPAIPGGNAPAAADSGKGSPPMTPSMAPARDGAEEIDDPRIANIRGAKPRSIGGQ
jgi:lambda family phage portal protein